VTCDVGIVSYRCFEGLSSCLESLLRVERLFLGRVIVVENGPRDFPPTLLERFPGVTFHKNRENAGFARACNQIIRRSEAPYICLLNPDTVLTAPFIGEASRFLDEHKDVAVLGPKIVNPDGTVQGSARGFPALSTAFFGRTSFITRLIPQNPVSRKNIRTTESASEPVEVDWVSGACMVVRKTAIEQVGMLDQGFFMYWEDCDWCTRFRQAGWKVIYHPGLGPVEHATGSCSKNARIKSLYWFHKSAVRLYVKYDATPFRIGSALAVLGGILRFLIFLPGALVFKR